MGYLMPDPRTVAQKTMSDMMEKKKEMVMRLVEAQIAGCVDLSPEEMIDVAFIMVNMINERIYEKKNH